MKKSKVILFISILFIILLNLAFVKAGPGGCSETSQVIISLYSSTNSHAAVATSSQATYKICYDEIFGSKYTGTGGNVCTNPGASNLVINLTSNVNAHLGDKTAKDHNTGVCYGDLVCRVTSSTSCLSSEREVLTLTANSNAHANIAGTSNMPFRVCCSSAQTSTLPTCGNGVVEAGAGETCDGNPASQCPVAGSTCSAQCQCVAPTNTNKKINTAYWYDANSNDIIYGVNLVTPIILFGETENYPDGTAISIRIYKTNSPDSILELSSTVDKNSVKTMPKKLEEYNSMIASDDKVKFGDTLYFKIIKSSAGNLVEAQKQSNDLKVLNVEGPVTTIADCGDIKDENTCTQTIPKDANGFVIKGCSDIINTPVCFWENDKDECVTKTIATQIANPNNIVAECKYTPKSIGSCENGRKKVEFNTEIIKSPLCPSPVCGYEAYIPCGRSVALLPFFTMTQLVSALIIVALIYLIIFKTPLFGKRSK